MTIDPKETPKEPAEPPAPPEPPPRILTDPVFLTEGESRANSVDFEDGGVDRKGSSD